jgi:acetyltransferase-like isoleucine patch superfamily enzyme
MRFLRSLRRRAVSRLSAALDAERTWAAQVDANCTLVAGAQLLQEAVVENFHGGKGDITIGANTYVRGRLLTYAHGGNINIGEWCYVGVRTEIWSMNSIAIGNRVLISHDVNIHDGTAHSTDAIERHTHFRNMIKHGHPRDPEELPGVLSAPIVIEDDAWISFGVTILRGVRIGVGSVIAAGSIVTTDVPSGMLYRNGVTPIMEPLQPGAAARERAFTGESGV